MNTPLGIPDGSIRGILAWAIGAAAIYCWVTQTPMTAFQEWITASYLGFYTGSRTAETVRNGRSTSHNNQVDLEQEDILPKARAQWASEKT